MRAGLQAAGAGASQGGTQIQASLARTKLRASQRLASKRELWMTSMDRTGNSSWVSRMRYHRDNRHSVEDNRNWVQDNSQIEEKLFVQEFIHYQQPITGHRETKTKRQPFCLSPLATPFGV